MALRLLGTLLPAAASGEGIALASGSRAAQLILAGAGAGTPAGAAA